MPGMKATMHEWKKGKLKSSSGKRVKSRAQAIAIGMHEDEEMAETGKKGKRKGRGKRPGKSHSPMHYKYT